MQYEYLKEASSLAGFKYPQRVNTHTLNLPRALGCSVLLKVVHKLFTASKPLQSFAKQLIWLQVGWQRDQVIGISSSYKLGLLLKTSSTLNYA